MLPQVRQRHTTGFQGVTTSPPMEIGLVELPLGQPEGLLRLHCTAGYQDTSNRLHLHQAHAPLLLPTHLPAGPPLPGSTTCWAAGACVWGQRWLQHILSAWLTTSWQIHSMMLHVDTTGCGVIPPTNLPSRGHGNHYNNLCIHKVPCQAPAATRQASPCTTQQAARQATRHRSCKGAQAYSAQAVWSAAPGTLASGRCAAGASCR